MSEQLYPWPALPTCRDETYYSTARNASYRFDKVGNRTERGEVYEAESNRLLQVNGFTLTYDDDGNLLSKTGNGVTQTYAWNALGQLTSVTTNGVTETYAYDGFGRRVKKGTGTLYLYDGDDLVMELNSTGQRVLEYTYYPGIDQPHSVKRTSDGKVFYYAMERPNHVAGLITGTGKLAAAYEYDPWGKPISVRQDSIVQSLRYGAREYDSATGLYYNRARFYDPDLGRFISEDPIGLAGGINPYAYVGGDPANLTDPSGLIPCIPGVTIYTANLVCDIPGISTLAQFDWPAWMTRGQVPVGFHGQGNRLTGDMVMAMIAFQSVRRDYEQIRSEAGSLVQEAADAIGSPCAQKLLDTGVGIAGDLTFFAGGTVIAAGVKTIRAARVAKNLGKANRAKRIAAGRAMVNMGASVAGAEWVGDATYTFGTQGASGALGRAAASGAEWGGMDFTSDGLTVWDFVPGLGTLRSGIQAVAACGGPDVFALLGGR